MKICSYCGRENEDANAQCAECGLPEFRAPATPTSSEEPNATAPPVKPFFQVKPLPRVTEQGVGRGLVKIDRATALERTLTGLCILMVWVAINCFTRASFGGVTRYSHRYLPPDPTKLQYVPLALLASVVFFAARRLTDNYYLLDPKKHLVYYRFKFLWFHRHTLLFQHTDLVAVTTQGKRYSGSWRYRVIVVSKTARKVPMSDWREERLDECNALAAQLAHVLVCESYAAPPRCETRVRIKDGRCTIGFAPLWLGLSLHHRLLAGACFVILMALMLKSC